MALLCLSFQEHILMSSLENTTAQLSTGLEEKILF